MMRCLYYVILETTFSINSSLVVVQHKRVVKIFFFVLQSYLVISCELDNFIFYCFFFQCFGIPSSHIPRTVNQSKVPDSFENVYMLIFFKIVFYLARTELP